MFWLVPLGLEGDDLWPPPWFTLVAVLLCCAVHVRANWVDSRIEELSASAELCDASSMARLWTGDAGCQLAKQRLAEIAGLHPIASMAFRPQEPRLYQALTSLFVHGGLAHLLFNMVFLWTFGGALERRLGFLRTLGLFVVGGVLAAYLGATTQPLVGASGAIAALMGSVCIEARGGTLRIGYLVWVVLLLRAGTLSLSILRTLLVWAALQLMLRDQQAQDGVAYGVHLAGFAVGLAFSLGRMLKERHLR